MYGADCLTPPQKIKKINKNPSLEKKSSYPLRLITLDKEGAAE
jgi:hypothetical protein